MSVLSAARAIGKDLLESRNFEIAAACDAQCIHCLRLDGSRIAAVRRKHPAGAGHDVVLCAKCNNWREPGTGARLWNWPESGRAQ